MQPKDDKMMPQPEEAEGGWDRVAWNLVGEGLTFRRPDHSTIDQGLVVGVTQDAFVVYRQGLSEPEAAVFAFDQIGDVAPLEEGEVEKLRAAYRRDAEACLEPEAAPMMTKIEP